MKRSSLLVIGIFASFIFSSCLQVNKPPTKVVDVNEGNIRIYGEAGAAPKQSQVTYDKLPDEIERADKIKNILYPS